MSFPISASLVTLLVAAFAAGMTCILLLRKESNSLHRTLGGLLGATALANFANGLGLLDEEHALFWRKMAMLGELAQPAALLYIGLAFLKPSDGRGTALMLWPARITGGAGLRLDGSGDDWSCLPTTRVARWPGRDWIRPWAGPPFLHIYCSRNGSGFGSLELVLSASREPIRYQFKFILIGLGGLAALRYLSGQPDAVILSVAV